MIQGLGFRVKGGLGLWPLGLGILLRDPREYIGA